jgi:hypothetical protein
MKDMTAEAERGDIEPTLRDADDSDAELRAAREKERQRAQHIRRNARATYRAMEGWQRVGSEEDWLKICAASQEQYESGRFLLERLGAARYLDPKLMATILALRQRLITESGISTAAEAMLVDLAVLNYYHALRVQGWIGDLALHLEEQFFGQDASATNGQERGRPRGRRGGDDLVRRLGEQLLPLSDRANRMFIHNLKAIKELRQGLVPAIAIGRAEHVTVTNRQNGRARRTKAMLVEKGLEVVDDGHERSGSQLAPIGRVPQPLGH